MYEIRKIRDIAQNHLFREHPEDVCQWRTGFDDQNPLIAAVLYYNKTIDTFGAGFERVFRLCRNAKYKYTNMMFKQDRTMDYC